MQIVRLNCAFSRNLGRGDDVDGLGAIMRGSLKLRCKVTNLLYVWMMKKYISTITGKKFGVFYAIRKKSRKIFDRAV